MSTRAYIARINRDGIGLYVYLGHNSYPQTAGRMLLENYAEDHQITALIKLGSIMNLDTTPERSESYHLTETEPWYRCKPEPITAGTDEFFAAHHAMPFLYAWTPDGWFGAFGDTRRPPDIYHQKLYSLSPDDFQHWLGTTDDPTWTQWLAQTPSIQRPIPLTAMIEQYEPEYRRLQDG